jgi:hypothetical protein
MKRYFPSMINTKLMKQEFLRGQPYDITEYVELKDPKKTSYQSALAGRAPIDKAKQVGHERSSCGFGGVIPDPMVLAQNQTRMKTFSSDLKKMTGRQFNYTGDSWNV